MINISKFDHCFGCGVCAAACPKKIISMYINEDGFFSPKVDETRCVECGICLDVCAFNHDEICQQSFKPISTAAWSNDADTRFNCTSGGAAYEIAKLLLADGYKVCGVRYDISQQKAEHIIVTNEEELKLTVGSKYIQSETFSAFSQFKLSEKYFVVGTPCQIDSLRLWIRKRKWEDNFILMDFFCHSVPSVLMWKKYLEYTGIKNPDIVQFRNKRNGWPDSTTVLITGDGREWFSALSKGDLFYAFFLGDRCPNECCVKECKYKQQKSAADIRIGDLWGYKYINNQKGVNSLVAFTHKGSEIIRRLESYCTLEPCDFKTVSELQMKHNVVPKRSWSTVRELLKTNHSITYIYRRARIIEIPESLPQALKYYYKRILQKLHLKNEN